MLPTAARLRSEGDIRRALLSGKRRQGRFFVCSISPTHTKHTRFAVIVSKRISKLATVRNRNKRIITEYLRTRIVPDVKSGYDVVIRLTTNIADLSREDIAIDLATCLKILHK